MRRVIAYSSLIVAAALLGWRYAASPPAAAAHFTASEIVLGAGFFTLAIAAILRRD